MDAIEFLSLFPGNHLYVSISDRATPTHDLDWCLNTATTDIYFTVNENDGSSNRKEQNIVRCRAIFLDDDNPRKAPRTQWPLTPSIVVQTSPDKYHYYWLTSTTNFAEWKKVQEALVIVFDGDPNVKDIPRILRMPETTNSKNGFKAEVIASPGTIYEWTTLVRSFPPLPEDERQAIDIVPESEKFDPISAIQMFLSGKHITSPMNSLIMHWTYRYSQDKIEGMLDSLFSQAEGNEPRYTLAYNQIGKFINSAKKSAGDVTILTYDDWETPTPIPESYDMYEEVEFPTEWVPKSMMEAAQEIASYNLMSVHDVLPALLICTCMSINKKAKVQAGSKSLESYFHLTAFFIADSGRFKSGVYDQVLKGLVKANKEQVDAFNKDDPRIQLDMKSIDKAITQAQGAAIKPKEGKAVSLADILGSNKGSHVLVDALEALKNRRVPGLFVDDITEEGAVQKAFNAGGVINYVAEEGQGILSAWTNKYSKSDSGTDFALRGMSGSMYRHDRKGSDRSLEFRPVASGMIFVQPDIYETQFISNSNINSSGMAARILPIYWKEPDFKGTSKTRENCEINEQKLQTYWDTVYKLAIFNDLDSDFHYETDDMDSPQLVKPVTKICINDNHIDKYNDLFNTYWHRYAPGEENEGRQELLNKCNTLAYVLGGCIYAYNNCDTFYGTESHPMDTMFFNCVASMTEYLVQKKNVEYKLKTYATKVRGAKKVLKTLTSPSNVELCLEGINPSVFIRMTNYNRPSTDTDIVDAGQDFLIELGYLKISGDKMVLNPKYTEFR